MCGFAGVLSSAGWSDAALTDHATRMIAPLAHRGPDDSGVWTDQDAGIALGFRRLAILDLSPAGHQPMCSSSGRFTVVFNGELYNFAELRRDLGARGCHFRGHSDTEVMLAAFDEWGIAGAIVRFLGMFAFAVWDADRRELSLCRDRIGKKPLYVYRQPGLVSFGSELKALLAGPEFDRRLDRTALASYLRHLCVPAPKTIFAGAFQLPPAHLLTFSSATAATPASRSYWSLEEAARAGLANPFEGSEGEAVDALDALLLDAVRKRMCADVPLGALLSGGIDSSTVVALMQESNSRPVSTYTIGFTDPAFDETDHAARVARHLGTDHTALRLTDDDACALVPRMANIFDEPFADPSEIPTLLVSQLARQGVTVALCGDGGDELFGGYNRYVYGSRLIGRMVTIPHVLRRPIGAAITIISPKVWDRGRAAFDRLAAGAPRQHFGDSVHKVGCLLGAATATDMYRSLLSAWQDPGEVLAGDHSREAAAADDLDRIFARAGWSLLNRMMLADQQRYLPDDLLAKIDRVSMSTSLEVRAPLLDHRVIEFSWRLPSALKVRGRIGKWILRQVLARRVPPALTERPKMGFSVPIDRWLRGPLRPWAESLLTPRALAADGLFDERRIRRAWRALADGRSSNGAALWAVLMFQAWRVRWLA